MNAESLFDFAADQTQKALQEGEGYAIEFHGEDSAFIRINHAKVRQAGDVVDMHANLSLFRDDTHASHCVSLSGERRQDREAIDDAVKKLRSLLADLPPDPYWIRPQASESRVKVANENVVANEFIDAVASDGEGLDLVGFYAAGKVAKGFRCDRGSRHFFESHPYSFDFSAFLSADKATKSCMAGTRFDREIFASKLDDSRRDLEILAKPSRTLKPGGYRAFLAPAAVNELLGLVCSSGFSSRALQTQRSPLFRLQRGDARFSPKFALVENTGAQRGPAFSSSGFLKPDRVILTEQGAFKNALVSPQSAKEYGVEHTGSDTDESPQELEMTAGTLADSDVLSTLGEGLYISNLWYTNFSDLPSCRVTGMTRFATFWVENGEIVSPVNVMRFDDSLYSIFGDSLEALTQSREVMASGHTYYKREITNTLAPGALVSNLRLTL